MKLKILIAMLLSCVLVSSCTTRIVGNRFVVNKSRVQYSVHLLPKTWHEKRFRRADLFFTHESGDANILLNAQCEKVSDSPLSAFTAQLLVSMGKYDIVSQTSFMVSDREALVSEVNVKLDGVARYLKIMVLRKNRCVVDAILSARTMNTEEVRDFDEMIKTLLLEADL